MIPLPLHLSHAADAADGGIATVVPALIAAQQSIGLDPIWLTADQWAPHHRDLSLHRAVVPTDQQ